MMRPFDAVSAHLAMFLVQKLSNSFLGKNQR
jgi:hypothetical protein